MSLAAGVPRALRSSRTGFTLLELLIVMAIMTLVAGIAVPAMAGAARATRMANATAAFVGDLRLARTEAIRRNRTVYVAKTGPSTYTIEYLGGRTLSDDVTFVSGPDTLRFAAFGPTVTGMTAYVLEVEGEQSTIRLSAAGNASVE